MKNWIVFRWYNSQWTMLGRYPTQDAAKDLVADIRLGLSLGLTDNTIEYYIFELHEHITISTNQDLMP